MKFLRPGHRQLLKMLTSARQRAGLTPADLVDKVTASPGFALNYGNGERRPIDISKRLSGSSAGKPRDS